MQQTNYAADVKEGGHIPCLFRGEMSCKKKRRRNGWVSREDQNVMELNGGWGAGFACKGIHISFHHHQHLQLKRSQLRKTLCI